LGISYDDFLKGYDAITGARPPDAGPVFSPREPEAPGEGTETAAPVSRAIQRPSSPAAYGASPDPMLEEAYQAQRRGIARENMEKRGELTRGVLRGIDQMQSSLYGMAGLAGSAMGIDRLKNWGIEGYRRNVEEAELNPASVPSFRDITGPVSAYKYGAGKVGELLPSVAESVGMALLGAAAGSAVEPVGGTVVGAAAGLLGKTALKKSIEKMAGEMVTRGISREVAERAASKLAMRSLGGATGVVAGTFPLEAGGNYAEALTERGADAPLTAAATGLASSFLELAGGSYRTISRIVGPEKTALFRKALEKADTSLLGSIIKEAAVQAPQEFAQEAGQELLSIANLAIADPTFEAFTGENAARMFEAGMAGAVGGGVFGGIGGAYSRLARGRDASMLQKRIDELSGVPEGQRTDEQQAELAQLQKLYSDIDRRPVPTTREEIEAEQQYWDQYGRNFPPENIDQGAISRRQQQLSDGMAVQELYEQQMERAQRVPDSSNILAGAPHTESAGPVAMPGSETSDLLQGGAIRREPLQPVSKSAAESAGVFLKDFNRMQSPAGAELLRDRLAGEALQGIRRENYPMPPAVEPAAPALPPESAEAPLETIDRKAHEAATSPLNERPEPTEAQKEAGNYKKGRVNFQGLGISIENPQGSIRSGTDKEGKRWESTLQNHYGYILGTKGKDKDHVDAFIGPNPTSERAYVVDQIDPGTGKFDEHKVILGANSQAEAEQIYRQNYAPGWQGKGAVTGMGMKEFKRWVRNPKQTKKPVSYKEGQAYEGENQAGMGSALRGRQEAAGGPVPERGAGERAAPAGGVFQAPEGRREGEVAPQAPAMGKPEPARKMTKKERTALEKKLQKARAEHEQARRELARDLARKADLETRGEAAVSDYDKSMGHGLETNLWLNANHVAASQRRVESTAEAIRELEAALSQEESAQEQKPIQEERPEKPKGPRLSSDLEAALEEAAHSVDKIEAAPTTTREIAEEKAHVKDVIQREVAAGNIPLGSAVRATDVEELQYLLENKRLREGRSFEGRPGISATEITTRDKPVIPMYGDYEHVPVGIVAPRESIVGRGESANEVLLDPKTDVTKLRFTIDKHDAVYSFEELPGVLRDIEKQSRPEKQPHEMTREEFTEQAKTKLKKPFLPETHGFLVGTEKHFEQTASVAHRQHVETALKENKIIPPEVLNRYPDLAEKYGKQLKQAGEKVRKEPSEISLGDHVEEYLDALKNYPVIPQPGAKAEIVPTTKTETAPASSASRQLAAWVKDKIAAGKMFSAKDLFAKGNEAFGGSQAEGKYTPKDAYDAMEMGVNQYILDHFTGEALPADMDAAKDQIKALQRLINLLPTQSKRTAEMDEFQQFSTPPPLAYLAAWAANITGKDTVLEPSAGIGGLAVFAKASGARTYVNEFSERRAGILKQMGFDRVFTENAEQLDNILPDDVRPTIIIMNPPFSSTAGRITGQRKTSNAERHIEQALNRLQSGGRLVAIVGRGMAMDAPAFRKWWNKITGKYAVRADIGLSGKGYQKYGTSFDNRLIIIDKIEPKGYDIVKGSVEDVKEAPPILKGVRDARQQTETGELAQQSAPQPGRIESLGEGGREGGLLVSPRAPADVVGHPHGGTRPGQQVRGDRGGIQPGRSEGYHEDLGGKGQGRRERPSGTSGRQGQAPTPVRVEPSRPGLEPDGGLRETGPLEVRQAEEEAAKTALSDSVYDQYKSTVSISKAKPHPGTLVESAAMATVKPPPVAYRPSIPEKIIKEGKLSDAQLENVVRAGQAHNAMLESGERQGYFIGDGTGVGKGREIAGIILDNWNKGRKQGVWLSANSSLFKDARRDVEGIGDDPEKVFEFGKIKPGTPVKAEEGILFTTYATLKNVTKSKEEGMPPQKRIDQIVNWLGKDFDGVIVFDESHQMGNAIQVKGERGTKDPSKTALAGIELQDRLPKARVVYVSATGATEVLNLAYAKRLGLWGAGTAFPNVKAFVSQISSGGIAAMELVARDLKAMGKYLARSLSYHDVTYDRLEHSLSDEQRGIYDKLAEGWQVVLNNVNKALEVTGAFMNGDAKGAAMAAFWGSHQRFFNQIITSLQMPSVLKRMHQELDTGNSCVIQLVNTNEASLNRAIAKLGEEDTLEDLDLTPRDQLAQYIAHSFPVFQYEEYMDDNGNIRAQMVLDSNGNPVQNREAVEMRERLLDEIGSIKVPDGPMEMILNEFGAKNVAEITGRTQRVVVGEDGHRVKESRSKAKTEADASAFQAGKKRVLIFSSAGGTGLSYHADLTAKNQEKRIHFLVQPGWRADVAVQGFGRTHRTNQRQAPHYLLVTTDLKGQARFISSIARRLDQLGALTKGQRQAGSQGFFTARDNLESRYAQEALLRTIDKLFQDGHIGGVGIEEFERQTGLKLINETGNQTFSYPQMTQFLNRLLSLKYEAQNAVFDAFSDQLDTVIEREIEFGTLDQGLENIHADKIVLVKEETVHKDEKTGAETKYVEVDITNPAPRMTYAEGQRFAKTGIYRNVRSGKIWAAGPIRSTTNNKTGEVYNVATLKSPATKAQQVHEDELTDTKKWTKLEGDAAREAWEKHLAEAPKTVTERTHMITGAVLPIWDRLTGSTRIVRLQTSDGKRFLGRLINHQDLNEVLANLGASRSDVQYTPAKAIDLLGKGFTLRLANNWSLAERWVSGEKRIELTGPNYAHDKELDDAGIFRERIQYTTRYFVPTGEEGETVLARLTRNRPIVDETAPYRPGGRRAAFSISRDSELKWKLSDLFDYAMENPAGKVRKVEIRKADEEEADRIEKDAKIDVSGYAHIVDNYSIRHILKQHGNEAREALRGQAAITREDILHIPEIIQPPNKIRLGKSITKHGNRVIQYIKRVNGFVYYLEEVRTATGELVPKTMYKKTGKATASSAPSDAFSRSEEPLSQRPETLRGPTLNNIQQFQRILKPIVEKLPGGPRVEVVNSVDDLPAHVAEEAKDRGGIPEAAYDRETGAVYLVGENIPTPERLQEVLLHELVGHYGVEALLGDRLQPFLREVFMLYGKKGLQEVADLYGFDLSTRDGRMSAAREKIARMAEKGEKPGFLKRLYAAIREALRNIGFTIRLTEADIKALVARAGRAVESGGAFRPGSQGAFTPRYSQAAPMFYSQLQRTLLNKLPGSGQSETFRSMIDSWANKGEFKAEELQWSGLLEWLAERKGKIGKQEILDFLKQNEVQIEEATKYRGLRWHAMSDEELREAAAIVDSLGYEEFADLDSIEEASREELLERIRKAQILPDDLRLVARKMGIVQETRYDMYTQPGGENYRELLLTLPVSKDEKAVDSPNGIFRAALDTTRNYRSPHWTEPNVFAHVRFDDRTGPDGEKLLHIAEVQSDWAQEGRKKGFRKDFAKQELHAENSNGYWEVTTKDGDFVTNIFDPEVKTEEAAIKEARRRLAESPAQTATAHMIPGGPFVTSTGSWAMLAMKRMIRYAAENGYGGISWDPGTVQAERYDLSKQVDTVYAAQDSFLPGTYNISIEKDGVIIHSEETMSPDALSDFIGKDLSEKIIAQAEQPGKEVSFRGLDLKVGGEGMKGFYDRILPSEVNKYVKKWGARVGETNIPIAHGTRDVSMVHFLPVTDAMRESAMKGQPLFSLMTPEGQFKPAFSLKDAGRDEFLSTIKAASGRVEERTETGFLGRLFITAEHWKNKVGKAIFDAAQGREEDRHQIMNLVLKAPEVAEAMKVVMFKGKGWWTRQKGYDLYDQSDAPKAYQDIGHHIDYMDRMNWKWRVHKDENGNPVYQKDAYGKIIEPYRDKLVREGAPKDVIEAVDKIRDMLDEALELQSADIRKLLNHYEKARKPVPVIGTQRDAEGKPHQVTLKDLYNQMGWLKGSYSPRIREAGDWFITSARGGERYRFHQPSRRAAYKFIERLKREGHKNISDPQRIERLPESIYQDITIPDIQAAVDRAVRGADLDPEIAARLRKEVLESAADILKERGFRAHKIQRSEGDVVRGYITDPLTRNLMYAQQTAGGIAKSKAASQMFKALMGEYQTYEREGDEWVLRDDAGDVTNAIALTAKELESDRQTKSVHEGGIDPAKEPERYQTYADYIHEMLRNPDATDRAIAFGKSLVSFKYLGFSPRTVLANITAMATTVPPALHEYAMGGKGGLFKVGKELMSASRDFAGFMTGKKTLGNKDEQAFMERMRGSANLEQFTREAMANLAGAYGKSWQAVMDKAMWMFRKSEEWIRGSTMLAGYRLARARGLSHEEAADAAVNASNKAHGIYGKATMPMWSMGSNPAAKIGQMGYTYAKFAHNYLQTLYDLGANKRNVKAFTFALLSPAVLAGSSAMAATPILMEIGKAMMRAVGDDRDPEKMVYDVIRENLGGEAERVARHGLLGAAGVDLSGSLAVGMQTPRTLLDLTGAFGGIVEDIGRAGHYLATGQPGRAAERAAPGFLGNFLRAMRELNGATTSSGNRVWDERGKPYIPTGGETAGRILGFRSGRRATVEAREREARREQANFSDRRKNIYEEYRAYLADAEADPGKLRDILDKVERYNTFIREHDMRRVVPLISRDSMRDQVRKMLRPNKSRLAVIESYEEQGM